MKTPNFKRFLTGSLISAMLMMIVISAPAQIESKDIESLKVKESKVTIREGQLIDFVVEAASVEIPITVRNPTDLSGDVDLVAFDQEGVELDRSTIEFGPDARMTFAPQAVFSDIKTYEIDSIHIAVSLRPRGISALEAVSLPKFFFSQLDSRWADKKVGSSGKTIKQIGCAMTSVTMAAASKMTNVTPLTMNAYLSSSSVGGYTNDGNIYWAKPQGFQPTSGFKFIGTSVNGTSSVKNAAFLKSLIDGGHYVVASSTRFGGHWVVIYKYNGTGSKLSDFEYLDPGDSNYIRHTVDDGKVTSGSQIRVYK